MEQTAEHTTQLPGTPIVENLFSRSDNLLVNSTGNTCNLLSCLCSKIAPTLVSDASALRINDFAWFHRQRISIFQRYICSFLTNLFGCPFFSRSVNGAAKAANSGCALGKTQSIQEMNEFLLGGQSWRILDLLNTIQYSHPLTHSLAKKSTISKPSKHLDGLVVKVACTNPLSTAFNVAM